MIFAVFCMIQMLSALGTRVCLASSVDFDVLQKLNEQGVAFIFWAIMLYYRLILLIWLLIVA